MPIYAYKCESCGHGKDALQKISEPPLTDCPSCGAATFKKQLTAAGFQLKGSGWYVTDFRGGDNKTAAAASSSPSDNDGTPAASTSAPVEKSTATVATPTPSTSTSSTT
ncbi:MAG: FmdB family zinc ribbon protein [Burkholderiaceae bacterium]